MFQYLKKNCIQPKLTLSFKNQNLILLPQGLKYFNNPVVCYVMVEKNMALEVRHTYLEFFLHHLLFDSGQIT